MIYKNKEEILIKSKEAIGKTFGEIDRFNRLSQKNNKGGLGQIVEESLFEYKVNSRSEPDFVEAGVELKVTPMKLNKNGSYSAKERLVLNIIDYDNDIKLEFENSSFWKKNKTLLLMFYLHEFDKPRADMKIFETLLYEYPLEDLEIIKQDYEYIVNEIKKGNAHILSEADTMYLGACPKGASKKSLRPQPNSNVLAMQRAYALKQSYMTSIVRKYVVGSLENEKIIKNIQDLKKPFTEYVMDRVKPYIGETVNNLKTKFDVISTSKQVRAILVSKMLDVINISKSQEFMKSGMKFKTIYVNKNNVIKENMSFPAFDFREIVNEEWENSEIRNTFLSTRFVFAIFKEDKNGNERFHSLKFWKMPLDDLDIEYKKVWEKTKEILLSGNIVKSVQEESSGKIKRLTNFPKQSENRVGHVRPHGRNANDTCILPIRDRLTGLTEFTKQSFWLNNKYIKEIILDLDN